MLAYGIKIYFTDGRWAYYYGRFEGKTSCGTVECRIRCFETQSEANREAIQLEDSHASVTWDDGSTSYIHHCVLVRCNY